jgi:dynein heavy chain
LAGLAVFAHQSGVQVAQQFSQEHIRQHFMTPAMFIEFLGCYQRYFMQAKKKNAAKFASLSGVLEQIQDAGLSAGAMTTRLNDVESKFRKKTKEVNELARELAGYQKNYDELNESIAQMEQDLQQQNADTEAIDNVIKRELDKFHPQLERAISQLKSLNRSDINDLRAIQEPPVPIKNAMEIVWLLAEADANWKAAIPLLGDPLFISKVTSIYSEERRVAPPVLSACRLTLSPIRNSKRVRSAELLGQ